MRMLTAEKQPDTTGKPAKESPVLSIINLNKSFGSNHVLVDFNLDVKKGESVVVLGKSGSGKSVLIKCIIGLLQPDSGSIFMLKENISDLKEDALDKVRAKVG